MSEVSENNLFPYEGECLDQPVDSDEARVATGTEVFTWIKQALLAQTSLSDDAAALVAFWAISSWFQNALIVRPCLVITGAAHEASRVLQVLRDLCCCAALVPGFAHSHLEALRCCLTVLITEPNLNKSTANLLSSLTFAKSLVVNGSYLENHSKSAAIYAGEDPETHRIQNSIHIHIPLPNAESPSSPAWSPTMVERLPVHLKQYWEKNLTLIKQSSWTPAGLYSAMATVATQLGRCIVEAPELQEKLVTLLKTQDHERLSDMSNTIEAVLIEAILNLIHQGKPKFLVREIADEVNRIQKARGERLIYSPERIGRKMKKIGLPARHISKDGNSLEMNLATVKRAHELAVVYGCAGLNQNDENLHCPHCDENKQRM
jgi:hypothetical protein